MSELTDRFASAASRIYDQVSEHAVRNDDGELSWLVCEVAGDETVSVGLCRDGFYQGRAGIAVFFSLMSRYLPSVDSQDVARETIEPLTRTEPKDVGTDLGLRDGVGSDVLALTEVGLNLDDPKLVDTAIEVATAVTKNDIKADQTHSVMDGGAGLLLSLLRLRRVRDEPVLGKLACEIGDHLIENRTTTEQGHQAWVTSVGSVPLTGFSHGCAGIAYALRKLYEQSANKRYLAAATDGVRFEREAYSASACNWQDLRETEKQFMDAWCHGRTGIVLSRVDMGECIPVGYKTAIECADAINRDIQSSTDQLCCGNAGRVDALIELSNLTGNSRYLEDARKMGHQMLDEVHFSLPAHGKRLFNPTLFQGITGVGYMCLRLHNPSGVPCLLLPGPQ